ncbi:MAG: hypothetical protein AAFY76_09925, partial [Cyanobacteria bacterium J06649_11]
MNQDIPFGMEYFPSDDRGAEEVIRSLLQQCDVFALVGHENLGSKKRENGETWVEWELKLAIAWGKRIIAVLPDIEFEQKSRLKGILNEANILFKEYSIRNRSTLPTLSGAFSQCYHQTIENLKLDPICGLVSLTSLSDETRILDENLRQAWSSPNLKKAVSHLIAPRRVLRRIRANEHEREYAGKTLWRYGNFFGRDQRTTSVFFDGGASTIFCVARLFQRLKESRIYYDEERKPFLRILTNSPLCFELASKLSIELNIELAGIRLLPQNGYNEAYGVYLGGLQEGEQPSAEEL